MARFAAWQVRKWTARRLVFRELLKQFGPYMRCQARPNLTGEMQLGALVVSDEQ
jgi:hypothetical protein